MLSQLSKMSVSTLASQRKQRPWDRCFCVLQVDKLQKKDSNSKKLKNALTSSSTDTVRTYKALKRAYKVRKKIKSIQKSGGKIINHRSTSSMTDVSMANILSSTSRNKGYKTNSQDLPFPRECDPFMCEPGKCNPEKCAKILLRNSRGAHQLDRCFCTLKLEEEKKKVKCKCSMTKTESTKSKTSTYKCMCEEQIQQDHKPKLKDNIAQSEVQVDKCTCVVQETASVSTQPLVDLRKSNENLLPYECEPLFCTPGKCEPLVCADRIKVRDLKDKKAKVICKCTEPQKNKTEKLKQVRKIKQETSTRHPIVDKETKHVTQSINKTKHTQKELVRCFCTLKLKESAKNIKCECKIQPSQPKIVERHVECECKIKPPEPIIVERHVECECKIKPPEPIIVERHVECECKIKPPEPIIVERHVECECKIKPSEPKASKVQESKERIIKPKNAETQSEIKIDKCTCVVPKTSNISIQSIELTRVKRQLLPYECEPFFCTPGNCDPLVCAERIRVRDLKDKGTKVLCKCFEPEKLKSESLSVKCMCINKPDPPPTVIKEISIQPPKVKKVSKQTLHPVKKTKPTQKELVRCFCTKDLKESYKEITCECKIEPLPEPKVIERHVECECQIEPPEPKVIERHVECECKIEPPEPKIMERHVECECNIQPPEPKATEQNVKCECKFEPVKQEPEKPEPVKPQLKLKKEISTKPLKIERVTKQTSPRPKITIQTQKEVDRCFCTLNLKKPLTAESVQCECNLEPSQPKATEQHVICECKLDTVKQETKERIIKLKNVKTQSEIKIDKCACVVLKESKDSIQSIEISGAKRQLLPYECEPFFCTPGKCDSLVCAERIRVRDLKDKSTKVLCKCFEPDKLKSETLSVKCMCINKPDPPPIVTKEISIQPPKKKKVSKQTLHPVKKSKPTQKELVRCFCTKDLKESYKEIKCECKIEPPQPLTIEQHVKCECKIEPLPEPKNIVRHVECECKIRPPEPKTLKEKESKERIIKPKNVETQSDIKIDKCTCVVPKTSNVSIQSIELTRVKRQLLPYECEPFFCTPGKCDPLVCAERIRVRDLKDKSTKVLCKCFEPEELKSETLSVKCMCINKPDPPPTVVKEISVQPPKVKKVSKQTLHPVKKTKPTQKELVRCFCTKDLKESYKEITCECKIEPLPEPTVIERHVECECKIELPEPKNIERHVECECKIEPPVPKIIERHVECECNIQPPEPKATEQNVKCECKFEPVKQEPEKPEPVKPQLKLKKEISTKPLKIERVTKQTSPRPKITIQTQKEVDRCFCTLNLKKSLAADSVQCECNLEPSQPKATEQHVICECKLDTVKQETKERIIKLKNVKTQSEIKIDKCSCVVLKESKDSILSVELSRAKRQLLPYECEPFFCTPGKCDPLVCAERIRVRDLKDKSTKVLCKCFETEKLKSKTLSVKCMCINKPDPPPIVTKEISIQPPKKKKVSKQTFHPVKKSKPTQKELVRCFCTKDLKESYKEITCECKIKPLPEPTVIEKHVECECKIEPPEPKVIERHVECECKIEPPEPKNIEKHVECECNIQPPEPRATEQNVKCECKFEPVTQKPEKLEPVKPQLKLNKEISTKPLKIERVTKQTSPRPKITIQTQKKVDRCFCTLNLKKSLAVESVKCECKFKPPELKKRSVKCNCIIEPPEIKSVKTQSQIKLDRCTCVIDNAQSTSIQSIKLSKAKRQLLPFECEPSFCIPGKCDPFVCAERIRLRDLKNKKTEVNVSEKSKKVSPSVKCMCHEKPKPTIVRKEMSTQPVKINKISKETSPPVKKTKSSQKELEHCFCTLKLKKELPTVKCECNIKPEIFERSIECECNIKTSELKQKKVQNPPQAKLNESIYVDSDISKTKTNKLLPYECEPLFCTPGQCNPIVCAERIKLRDNKFKNISKSATNPPKTVQTRTLKRRRKFAKSIREEVPYSPKSRSAPSAPTRQMVQISSSFKFDIEFFKEKNFPDSLKFNKAENDIDKSASNTKRRSRTTRRRGGINYSRHSARRIARNTNDSDLPPEIAPSGQKSIVKISSSFQFNIQFSKKSSLQNDVQNDLITDKKSNFLKRCFCTLKRDMPQHNVCCQCTIKEIDAVSKRIAKRCFCTVSNDTPPEILPYACEPNDCIPYQCNPDECEMKKYRKPCLLSKCFKLLQRQKNSKTSAESNLYNIYDKEDLYKDQYTNTQTSKKQRRNSRRANLESDRGDTGIESLSSLSSGKNRQSVKLGSEVTFSIEFFKNRGIRLTKKGGVRSRGDNVKMKLQMKGQKR